MLDSLHPATAIVLFGFPFFQRTREYVDFSFDDCAGVDPGDVLGRQRGVSPHGFRP